MPSYRVTYAAARSLDWSETRMSSALLSSRRPRAPLKFRISLASERSIRETSNSSRRVRTCAAALRYSVSASASGDVALCCVARSNRSSAARKRSRVASNEALPNDSSESDRMKTCATGSAIGATASRVRSEMTFAARARMATAKNAMLNVAPMPMRRLGGATLNPAGRRFFNPGYRVMKHASQRLCRCGGAENVAERSKCDVVQPGGFGLSSD